MDSYVFLTSRPEVHLMGQKLGGTIVSGKDEDKVPVVLIGNKCDLEEERQITTVEGQDLATSYDCPFYESSASTRINIEEMLTKLCRLEKIFKKEMLKHNQSKRRENVCHSNNVIKIFFAFNTHRQVCSVTLPDPE